MLKLASGYKLTITSVEDDTTKEGIEYLKVKGKIYLQAYQFASEKKYLLSNFFNKIMVFGDKNYLEEIKKRVYETLEDEKNNKKVALVLKEAYINNVYFSQVKKIFSTLIVAQSDFATKKMKNEYSEKPIVGNYYIQPCSIEKENKKLENKIAENQELKKQIKILNKTLLKKDEMYKSLEEKIRVLTERQEELKKLEKEINKIEKEPKVEKIPKETKQVEVEKQEEQSDFLSDFLKTIMQ